MTASEPAVRLHTPQRTSPWSVAYEAAAVLAGLLFLLGTVSADWLLAFSVISSLAGLVALVLRWRFRTYTVTEDRLLLDEGVLERRNRVVPFARVQQVNLTQELLHRPLDLTTVHIETAGEGGASTVQLRVLARADAEALRSYVLDRRTATGTGSAGAGEDPAPEEAPVRSGAPRPELRPLGAMTLDDLTLAGLTHTGVQVALAAWIMVVGPLIVVADTGRSSTVAAEVGQGVLLMLLGAVAVAALGVGTAVGSSWLRNWGWTLTAEGGDFHVRRGLLEVRSQSWPRERVQQVTVIDNPLRRLSGRVSVLLHTAAAPGSHQATVVQVPLVRWADLDALLTALMGPEWSVPPLRPRPERARGRAVRRRALCLVVILTLPFVWRPGTLWVLWAWVAVAWPWGRAAHRRAGAAVTSKLVVFASGVLHHRIDMAPRDRVQSTRVSASPLQRRLGVATLYVDLAGTSRYGALRLSPRHFDSDAAGAEDLRRSLPRARSTA